MWTRGGSDLSQYRIEELKDRARHEQCPMTELLLDAQVPGPRLYGILGSRS